MEKICKHHVKGACTKNPCPFTHVDNVCKHHYFGTCRHGNTCKQSHQYKLQNKLQKKHKNTESFVPSHKHADMRIMLSSGQDYKYPHDYHSRDVIIVPDLFSELGDVYTVILREMKERDDVWKLWHGDSHWIADDHMKWKQECPTFLKIIDILAAYFRMEVKATRLNWYRDTSEWKPYHHDAAAVDEKKAKTQNLTIGVSFGATRDASFEHATTKTTVNIPLTNGMTYGFGSQVNIEWRHGIPQVKDVSNDGRISIIAWGWTDMTD